MKSVVTKEEIHRLKKAARDNNPAKMCDWATQFEMQIAQEFERDYKERFNFELENAISNFILAVAYVLHFSEETKFGKKRMKSFLEDLFVTVDMYRTGEYSPAEYIEALGKVGIIVDEKYDYSKIYREKENKYKQRCEKALELNDIEEIKKILKGEDGDDE